MVLGNFNDRNRTVNIVAKNYNLLDYKVNLQKLLESAYPFDQFEHLTKYELHRRINEVIINNYHGEEIHKFKLFEQNTKKKDVVGAFEIKVKDSRVDFLTINGATTSYEIKSELDNLSKLKKQSADYLLAFEYNYLVIDEKHFKKALEQLPLKFGILVYRKGKYTKFRKAEINCQIDPQIQLSLFSKKELRTNFPEENGDINKILSSYSKDHINIKFKECLKSRYYTKWNFLLTHRFNIFPFGLQFFFNSNIEPDLIYK